MLICLNCGKLHDDEYFSDDCTACGGDLIETKRCEKCDSDTFPIRALCDECIDEYKTTDNVIRYGYEWEKKADINDFLAYVFADCDINQILLERFNAMTESEKQSFIDKYCEQENEYFKEWCEKRWKEGK